MWQNNTPLTDKIRLMTLAKWQESQVTPELRSNMAAPCVASEVAVSLKAENSITSHVAPLHHCVQVWVHTLNPDCAPFDLILEASP